MNSSLATQFPLLESDVASASVAAMDVRAEEKLRRASSFLNEILGCLPVVACHVDADGTIRDARGGGLAEAGLLATDLNGRRLAEFRPGVAVELKRVVRGGSANFTTCIRHGGRAHYFDAHLRFDAHSGRGAVGFFVNVTTRVEAEAERNRKNRLLNSIVRKLPAIVGRLDAAGRVIEAQGEGLAPRGISPSRLTGQVFWELYPQSRQAFWQALRGKGHAADFVLSGHAADEEGEEWHADFFAVFDAEHGSGAVFFGRDITERRWLERKLINAADTEQQRIGADLHDGLGQQLTGLSCMAVALRDRLKGADGLPEEAAQAETIARLANEAARQSRALARGLCPVQLERAGLQAALEDVAYHAGRLHGIECRFVAGGTPLNFQPHSAIHLYRITQEAINNAIRHGAANRVRVTLRAIGESWRLTITDNGIGFDAARLASSKRGVGLRLMRYRATVIGAMFQIYSQPGRGTRVVCSFEPTPLSPLLP